MKKRAKQAGAKQSSPMILVTLENLDVYSIPEGGVQIRLPLDIVFRDEFQPRTKFRKGKMEELAESLKSQGQKQYPRVRWQFVDGKLRFVLDDGERRTRNYRTLGWKDAIFTLLPEEYIPKYDPNRELGQAAANAAQERHTHGEIVNLVRRIVAHEIAERKESGTNQHGAVQIALTKVSKAFGKSLGWANNYHMLGNLSDQMIEMLDEGEDGSEPKLKWGDAISLAPVPKEEQASLLTEAMTIFPKDPQARRTYISKQSRSARTAKGEKLRGRAYDDKQRFVNYQRSLRTLAERFAEGRSRQDNMAHMNKLLDSMRVTEVEELLTILKRGLDPFVNLYKLVKAARDTKLEQADLRIASGGGVPIPDDDEHDEEAGATNS